MSNKIWRLVFIYTFALCIVLGGTTSVYATALLSDDFTGTTIDTNKWTEFDAGGAGGTTGNVQQSATLNVTGTGAWGVNGLRSASTYDRATSDLIIESDVNISNCSSGSLAAGMGYGDISTATNPGNMYLLTYTSGALRLYYFNNGSQVELVSTSFTCTSNSNFHLKLVVWSAGGASAYINNSSTASLNVIGGTFTTKSIFLQTLANTVTARYDNLTLVNSAVANAPSEPVSLYAQPANGQVALSWTVPTTDNGSSITDYIVEYRAVGTAAWSTFADGTSTSTSATVTGLTNATSYNFRVYAVNGNGNGLMASATATPLDATFLLYDNFNTNTIDTNKWTEFDSATSGSGASAGNTTVTGGQLVVTGNNNWGQNGLFSVNSFNRGTQDVTIQGDVTFQSCTAGAGGIMYGPSTGGLTTGMIIFNKTGGTSRLYSYSTNVTVSTHACTSGVPIYFRMIIKASGGVDLYLEGASSPNATLTGVQAPATYTNHPFSLQTVGTANTLKFDNISIAGTAYFVTPSAPTTVVAGGTPSSVLVQWSDVAGVSDYIVEYKRSADSTWTTFADGVSTNRFTTITGLTNGTPYDIRVSSFANDLTSTPSSTVVATPGTHDANFYNHVISTGQSLSIGTNGTPVLTTTQPYNNKKLTSITGTFTPLVEASQESMSSALGNTLSSMTAPTAYDSIVTMHGVGGTAYTGLKKGTTPYTNSTTAASTAFSLSTTAGRPYKVAAVTVVHGEADESAGTTATQYEANLVEWQNDYQGDVQALTGQTGIVPLFTDQMSSWPSYSHSTPSSAIGQYNAAKNNPTKIYLVTPKYILDYVDTAHLTNYSYRRLGEYYGKVMKQVLVSGQSWQPVMPTSITRSANIIYADFHVPVAPLQFDTTKVLAKTNYGFEYSDSTSSASISSVELVDGDTVKITLNTTPTGSNQRLRYAYTGSSNTPGRTSSTAPRGNLRDSDTTSALYTSDAPSGMGTELNNWAMTFDEAITTDSTAPVRSAGSPSGTLVVGTTSTTLSLTTDETATCKYSTNSGTAYGSMTAFSTTNSTTHSTGISGLSDNTSYTYYIKCADADGNTNSSNYTISFSVASDTTAPNISATTASFTDTAASITWTTDEVADSQVEYGTDTGYGTTTTRDTNLTTSHSVTLSSLAACTMYHYRVRSADASSNAAISSDQTFTTSGCASSIRLQGSVRYTPMLGPKTFDTDTTACRTNDSFSIKTGAPCPTVVRNPWVKPTVDSTSTPTPLTQTFTRTLSQGMSGQDVKALQEYLNAQGYIVARTGPGSPGYETTYFGLATKAALIKFQEAFAVQILTPNNLQKGTGLFGPATRRVINSAR